MYKLSTLTFTAATLCLLFTSSVVLASEILVIDENLNALPSGYLLWSDASANASADIQIGSLGTSNGLIFDGSWDVAANGSEYAVGLMYPDFLPPTPFHVDPRDIEGITSVRWTLDAEVTSPNMTTPEQGIFAQLIVYQEQGDGSILGFSDSGNFVVTGQSVAFDITVTESDFGSPGSRPDFSASGRPIAFALQLGATYPKTITPEAFFVNGRMTADNWTVSVTDGGGIFSDSFESQTTSIKAKQNSIEQVLVENCLCPAPAPLMPLLNN